MDHITGFGASLIALGIAFWITIIVYTLVNKSSNTSPRERKYEIKEPNWG